MRKLLFPLLSIAAIGGLSMAAGQAFEVSHPYRDPGLPADRITSYENSVERVMSMSEDDLLALVPVQTAIRFCGCPNCDGGRQESNQLEWTIERPAEIRCRFCGHVYPSDEYPMDKTDTVMNPLGEKVTVRYHLDDDGNDYYFEGAIWHSRKQWLVGQAYRLAQTYHLTRKPEYARRAALIIDRFAQVYPGYCVVEQRAYKRRRYTARTKPPFPHYGGKWGRWRAGEIPSNLPLAYDLIYDSEEFDKLSAELGTDIRARIEDDFFRATVAYTMTFDNHMGNMAPRYVTRMLQIGRAIGEPEYVHWGYHWLEEMLQSRFFFDGLWCETPSYHQQTVLGIQDVIRELEGYSDPPGYEGEDDGLHFEDLEVEQAIPFLSKAIRAPAVIAYPNGLHSPVHDTWSDRRVREPRERSTCAILPGFGHAVLGAGEGEAQIQAQLHFSGGYGHHHADALNLSLFAFGREMLSDTGYTHTRLRWWPTSTIGHNLVAIDRQDQSLYDADGDLCLYVPNMPGFAAVEACAERAYGGVAKVYRRLVLLVSIDEERPYVVDVFHVKGGKTHDWLVHGSANHDQEATASIDLIPRQGTLLEEGEDWVEPVGERDRFVPYGLMRKLRAGRSDDTWNVTFAYKDQPSTGTRIHMLGGSETEVFLSETPSIRRAGDDDRKVYDYVMPQIVARREGRKPLESVFVSVIEPFEKEPHITSVDRIPLGDKSDDGVALRVAMGPRTDTLLIALRKPGRIEARNGRAALNGRIGLVSETEGRVAAGYLIGGTDLVTPGLHLASDNGVFEGTLESATRKLDGESSDAFVTSAELPSGTSLRNSWMIVTHGNGYKHGYGIDHIEERDGKTWIHLLDDHGLMIKGNKTTESYFPQRRIKGKNRFVIYSTAMTPTPD